MIRKAAEAAMWKLKKNPPALIPLKAPFERVTVWRPAARSVAGVKLTAPVRGS
jgi:hypothetical protein